MKNKKKAEVVEEDEENTLGQTFTMALFEHNQAGTDYQGIHTFVDRLTDKPTDSFGSEIDDDEWEEMGSVGREEARLYYDDWNCGQHMGMTMQLVEIAEARSMSRDIARDLKKLKAKKPAAKRRRG